MIMAHHYIIMRRYIVIALVLTRITYAGDTEREGE